MKTVITVDSNNVTVERDNPFSGERERTTYFVPFGGGYIRIRDAACRYPQVCDALQSTGNTLSCNDPANLPALIRRELRKRARIEKRELAGS